MQNITKKKMGLLTFSWINNPGSVLQAYALKSTFDSCGIDVSVLNAQHPTWGNYRMIPGVDTFTRGNGPWKIRQVARWIKQEHNHHKKMGKYLRFQKRFLNIDSPVATPEDLGRKAAKLDALVVGSDQVWNYDLPLVDACYFGGFTNAPSKKYAYAASFGKDSVDDDRLDETSRLLQGFDRISVREKNSRELAEKLSGKNVSVLPDPSLLLTADKWAKIEIPPPEKNYVLVYLREESDVVTAYAEKLAAQKGLQVVVIVRSRLIGEKEKKILDPREWLGYVRHADCVLTNSFHGVCFAMIFEKQFKAFPLVTDDWRMRSNTRLDSILELLGLQDAISRESGEEAPEATLPEIKYDNVNRILEGEREAALKFIHETVEDIYGN